MTTPNLIEKFETLASQRTVRTDRLDASVKQLLAKLETVTEAGDRVEVEGYELALYDVVSNVGSSPFWFFTAPPRDEYDCRSSCALDAELNTEKYLHGDFSCKIHGPNRADLISFAQRATRFVEALVAQREAGNARIAQAIDNVEAAQSRQS